MFQHCSALFVYSCMRIRLENITKSCKTGQITNHKNKLPKSLPRYLGIFIGNITDQLSKLSTYKQCILLHSIQFAL